MEVFYWIAGFLSCLGALREIAITNRNIDDQKIKKPYTGIMILVWVMLFLTWPYWYFYRK